MKTNIVDDILERKTKEFYDTEGGMEKAAFCAYVMRKSNMDNFGSEQVDFSKLTIKEKTFHGWLRPMAMFAETVINGRWDYWINIRATQEVEGKPIPKLNFRHSYDSKCKIVSDMIKDCLGKLTYVTSGYRSLELFVDWLLYAWGCSNVTTLPSEITDEINDYWYRNFKAQYMFAIPSDYFVHCASEIYGNGKFNATNFYPTPSTVVEMMVRMLYNEDDAEKNKYAAVCEPCMGSGIMLLYQSNHSLRLHGQDIDPLMCKIATVNGYFYMPWLVECDDATRQLLKRMSDKYNSKEVIWTDEELSNFMNMSTPITAEDEKLLAVM